MVVHRKPGETRTAVWGTVVNITVEADKHTKGKLLYHLCLFHIIPPAAAVWQDSCRLATLAHLHTRNAGLNFVWGAKDVLNHIKYDTLGSFSGISEY